MFFDIFSVLSGIIENLVLITGHVTGPGSFPQPLSPEEEAIYIEKFMNGDNDARNILIERNLRLVAHVVKKYGTTWIDSDDLISIGTIGLIKAVSSFSNDKGTRLATFAARCIENAILFFVTHITPFLFLMKKMAAISTFKEDMNYIVLDYDTFYYSPK